MHKLIVKNKKNPEKQRNYTMLHGKFNIKSLAEI